MGFRFRKSVKILPGVRVNVGNAGLSTTLGVRGASISVSKRGTRASVGIPGTGISYSEKLSGGVSAGSEISQVPIQRSKTAAVLLAFFLGGFGVHRFYLGQAKLGLVYLLFCWTLIPSLIGLVDSLVLLTASERSFKVKYASLTLLGFIFLSSQLIYAQSYSWTSKYVKAKTLYVREESSKESAILDTLQQYEMVMIKAGEDITKGWVEVKLNDNLNDNTSAFVYGPLLMDELPSSDEYIDSKGKIVSYSKKQAYNDETKYYRGPRGGCFYYTSGGRKQYVDRSYCSGQ